MRVHILRPDSITPIGRYLEAARLWPASYEPQRSLAARRCGDRHQGAARRRILPHVPAPPYSPARACFFWLLAAAEEIE